MGRRGTSSHCTIVGALDAVAARRGPLARGQDVGGGRSLGFCAFCTVAADGKSRSVSAGKYRLSIGDGDNDTLTHDFVATGSTVTLPL